MNIFEGLDIDKLLREAKEESDKVVKREAATKTRKEARKAKRRAATPRKKRQRGEDIPLTEKLVYRILDKTEGKVYITVGLGTTEQVVDKLQGSEHKLVKFKMNKGGQSIGPPRPYQCILDARGKKGNFRWFWKPTETYSELEVVDEKNSYAVFAVEPWPYYPGGLCFALQEVTPINDGFDHTKQVSLDAEYTAELDFLTAIKKAGGTVIQRFTQPDELVRLMAVLMGDTYVTEEAIEEITAYIMQHVTCWPPSPAEMQIMAHKSWLPPQE